jgi:hypothetical protein
MTDGSIRSLKLSETGNRFAELGRRKFVTSSAQRSAFRDFLFPCMKIPKPVFLIASPAVGNALRRAFPPDHRFPNRRTQYSLSPEVSRKRVLRLHEKVCQTGRRQITLPFVKEESERDPDQEVRDQQRRERLRQADGDCGEGASQQGLETDHKEGESRRRKMIGHVARVAPWL